MTVNLSMLPEISTSEEVAKVFRVTTRQINALAAQGRIAAIPIGRKKRFAKESIQRFIEEQLSCQDQIKAPTLPAERKRGFGKSAGTKVDGHAAKQLALAALERPTMPLPATSLPLPQGSNVRQLQPQASGI